jgi:hypothetical protein
VFHGRTPTPEERAKLTDAAVLKLIREAGPRGVTLLEMRPHVLMFEGQSDDQHRAAISNALTRARYKGHAKSTDGGKWVTA